MWHTEEIYQVVVIAVKGMSLCFSEIKTQASHDQVISLHADSNAGVRGRDLKSRGHAHFCISAFDNCLSNGKFL